jgi:alpha-L-fucosidase
MPNGEIQTEFVDTLKAVGGWLKQYGASIYGTRGGLVQPQDWGVVTQKNKTIYVHVLKNTGQANIFIPGLRDKIVKGILMDDNKPILFKQQPEGVFVYAGGIRFNDIDTIIELETQ